MDFLLLLNGEDIAGVKPVFTRNVPSLKRETNFLGIVPILRLSLKPFISLPLVRESLGGIIPTMASMAL